MYKFMKEQDILNVLYKLSLKAYKKSEVPVSALIIKGNKIISKAYNKKNICNNSLYHAEIICLMKAFKKLKTWNLKDCIMYVTLEPCDMCKELIQESRINKVFYINSKGLITNKYKKTQYEQMFVCENTKYSNLLKKFFKKIRN